MGRCEVAHGACGEALGCRFTVTMTADPSAGIFLMRVLMDYVVFADGGREVHMRKRRARER